MLTQLVALLNDASSGLSVSEISRALGAQPAAVTGMLDWLARAGRLIEVGPDGGFCGSCGLESQCQLLMVHGKRYILARQAPNDPSAPTVVRNNTPSAGSRVIQSNQDRS
jgi:FeoC-like transcriptional regulator